MKKDQIFIGDIKKCTKHDEHTILSIEGPFGGDFFGYTEVESELYKKDAILVKVTNHGYVDLEDLNSALDMLRVKKYITKSGWINNSWIMSTSPNYVDDLFVDSNSIRPYYKNENSEKISIKQLKKEKKQK